MNLTKLSNEIVLLVLVDNALSLICYQKRTNWSRLLAVDLHHRSSDALLTLFNQKSLIKFSPPPPPPPLGVKIKPLLLLLLLCFALVLLRPRVLRTRRRGVSRVERRRK